ncbi:DUF4269 domain-containing protein [Hymenobacter cavernae]|uniref:Alpha/beta hydrolase n=1 Tax=Hymenobacter cavernae TaxID=2044852 RepID=A0ABQ1UT80_9BACT|nr:DUF4269 domain-containing protein [Hymenobacter cavernae]GGF26196.1 alpha/beta hydrolase [Hymenobacter cavernae]
MFPFQHVEYLQHGTAVQQSAYHILLNSNLLHVLRPYQPLLVGTVPIGLQLPGSDLDIICEVHDLGAFESLLRQYFGHYPDFSLRRIQRQGHACIVAAFTTGSWPVEVFGQPVPSTQQHGYRHLLIEHRLLMLGGDAFRAQVQARRAAGLKTEPAFAISLGLVGDPYAALLALEACSDAELRARYFRNTV